MTTPPSPAEIDALLHELMQKPEQQARIIPLALAILLIDKGIITDNEFALAKQAAEQLLIQQVKANTSESEMNSMLFIQKLLGDAGRPAGQAPPDG